MLNCIAQHGKLVDLKWRIGIATESNSCRNLNNIYVTLAFKVLDGQNNEKIKTVELPYSKFQVLWISKFILILLMIF